MPSPHPTNKVNFACFGCRSAVKQPNSSNWDTEIERRPYACPNFKMPASRMGKYFKAPPKRDIKRWLKVELLFSFGERFDSSQTNIRRICDTLPATVDYLIESGNTESDVRARLDAIRNRRR